MSDPETVCTTCGRQRVTQAHHIAGEANDPTTTPVCTNGCHQFLSRRQLDHGVDLDREGPRGEVELVRARALGLADLLSLSIRRRHPELLPIAAAFDTCTAIASALLDVSDDPERPGRWLPDTIGARHRRPLSTRAVHPTEGVELVVIEQLVRAAAALGPSLLMEEVELAALSCLADDAESVYQRFDSLLQSDTAILVAWAEVPAQMFTFALHFQRYLVAFFAALTDQAGGDLSELIAMGQILAPVFTAMRTPMADIMGARSDDECREVLLGLPRALQTLESFNR